MSRLELVIMAGAESKEFLAGLTAQLDRAEKLLGNVAAATSAAQPEAAPAETKAAQPEAAPAETKAAKGKGKAKAAPAPEVDDALETAHADAEADAASEGDDDLFGDDEPADEGPTLEDVRKVVKDFATKHGKEKALNLLGKFKVTAINDIKKSDYGKVIELAKKHL